MTRWRNHCCPRTTASTTASYPLDYHRLSGDKRLIFGGGVVYGARDPANIEAIIRPKMLKAFPQLKDVKIDYAWTGNFLADAIAPAAGRSPGGQYLLLPRLQRPWRDLHPPGGQGPAEALRGQAERFDAFADLPHYPFPGGQLLRTPFTALGAWYYTLRDKLGI